MRSALAGFVEVHPSEWGRAPVASFVRGRAFVLWAEPPRWAGIFAIAPHRLEDLDEAMSLAPDERRHLPEPMRFLADGREFWFEGPLEVALGHLLELTPPVFTAAARFFERYAFVTRPDWSEHLWQHGSTEVLQPNLATMVALDPAQAWDWLEAPQGLRERVARLTATLQGERLPLLVGVARALLDEPRRELDEVAAIVGCSQRTVQRALAVSGDRFSEMRSRIRLALAEVQLGTTELAPAVIADRLGFASPGTFGAWFKRLTGHTPTEWRARAAR